MSAITGGEQQRVPGQEEADQQAGLGEHDRDDPEGAERLDQVPWVEYAASSHSGELDGSGEHHGIGAFRVCAAGSGNANADDLLSACSPPALRGRQIVTLATLK